MTKLNDAQRKKIARALEKTGHFSPEQVQRLVAQIIAEMENDEP